MVMRVCAEPGCPELVTIGNRCTSRGHAQAKERDRGSRQARGYDATHDRIRAEWAPKVAAGTIRCWRCRDIIRADEAWDLGHDDHDRTKYRGPEHANRCNRSAAGRAAHAR